MRRHVVQRYVLGFVLLVMQHCVAMAERAALNILAGEANMGALLKERRERQRLRRPPVYPLLFVTDGGLAISQHLHQLAMDVKTVRELIHFVAELLQFLLWHRGSVVLAELELGFVTLPLAPEPGGGGGAVGIALGGLEGHVEHCQCCCLHLLHLLTGHAAFLDELLAVDREDVRMLLDFLVHDGLCEHGLVDLVVSVPPETHNVHHNILGKLDTEFSSKLHDPGNSLGVIGVHVQDRRRHRLRHVRAVRGGA
mmetsp:Transcript_65449/g.136357  ORF Transcript_65449/g.136357 Transcript_65449/m.136357 type:complete len:253 (-) Transcript_65449:1429-2187(-)